MTWNAAERVERRKGARRWIKKRVKVDSAVGGGGTQVKRRLTFYCHDGRGRVGKVVEKFLHRRVAADAQQNKILGNTRHNELIFLRLV